MKLCLYPTDLFWPPILDAFLQKNWRMNSSVDSMDSVEVCKLLGIQDPLSIAHDGSVCMVCIWYIYGIYMVYIYGIYIYMVYIWYIYIWFAIYHQYTPVMFASTIHTDPSWVPIHLREQCSAAQKKHLLHRSNSGRERHGQNMSKPRAVTPLCRI